MRAGSRFVVSGFVVAMLAVPLSAAAEDAKVTLHGHRGALDASLAEPRFSFEVTVRNGLAVPVSAVEIGVLFAQAPEALEAVRDPGRSYRDATARPKDVGVVRQRVPVSLPAGGEVAARFSTPLEQDAPEPQVFLTHVLGYTLADATPALLFDLLRTEAAADEVAAVGFLAVAGEPADKREVRRRLAEDRVWTEALVSRVTAPIPARPSQEQAMARLYAVRALGVLGGSAARRALEALQGDATLGAFDEPLQVLRVARVVGSRLETPLAFAVPATARQMRDVVAAALEDLGGWPEVDTPSQPRRPRLPSGGGTLAALEAAAPLEPEGMREASDPADAPSGAVAADDWRPLAAAGGAALLAGALALLVLRRAGRRRSNDGSGAGET